MPHTSKQDKADHNQQIADLQRLHPRAASWLAGMPYSTFRDNAHRFSPNADGTFDARDIAIHSQPDEVKLTDAEAELVRKGAYLSDDTRCHLTRAAIGIIQRFGAAGCIHFVNEILSDLPEDRTREYTTENAIRQEFEAGIQAELALRNKHVQNWLGHWIYQCPNCKKYRAGRKWVKKNPNPSYEITELECDDCL